MANLSVVETVLGELAERSDAEFDAPRAALHLAALDNPAAELGRYEAHLAELARTAAAQPGAPAAALADVMASRYGYQGDENTYDDLSNADLIRVIDRRRGLPVALGLLYMAAGAQLNASIVGLAFPGHFLLRVETGGEAAVIDPFNGGRTCAPEALRALAKRVMGPEAELEPAFFEAVSPRDIVIRLLRNIRIRALQAGHKDGAIEIVRRMTVIAPRDARLWSDLAELHASCGNLSAAKAAFERSVAGAPNESFRIAAAAALQSVSRQLN